MESTLYNQAGESIGVIRLNEYIFGIEPNQAVMHQAMVRQLANRRKGTHNTLGRGEVRGSTRKLYRQKGTGRARQGSIRAPHRPGGGIAHGPHPRSYEKKMPRKMRRLAVRSALSAKQAAEQIRFVDGLSMEKPRTRDMVALLDAHGLNGKTLIVIEHKNDNVQRSASNLPGVKVLLAHYLNVIDLLHFDNILFCQPAIAVIERFLGNGTSDIDTASQPDMPAVVSVSPAQQAAEAELDLVRRLMSPIEADEPAASVQPPMSAREADEEEENNE